ncbi:MAG: hypothetical protein EPO68_09900 [Planctomycetota bacterium]|nr:MAG: hypothetical protein EPO68_09900 [Planctomycetota bacterium]
MKLVLVSQRVVVDAATGERRDALDQAWHPFLEKCGLVAVPVPNDPTTADWLCASVDWAGVLLTGGNDLASLGGDAPERDRVEEILVASALDARRPVLGVCRGMQFLLAYDGAKLERVDGHARTEHALVGESRRVNSYHRFGCREAPAELAVLARAQDGVIEAVRHRDFALRGVMWHPERGGAAHPDDVALFREWFAP